MNDLIPPYGILYDVVPGDPWQPEPAARYNAVNEMLRQEHNNSQFQHFPSVSSDCLLWVCNASEQLIPIHSPVQLDTSFVPDSRYRLDHRHIYAFGKPVENAWSPWGVAQENIPPGQAGPVQVSGVVLLNEPQGFFEKVYGNASGEERKVRNNFIFPGRDGKYHFGQRGGAEVIWYCSYSRNVLCRLATAQSWYTGMFAVLENGDGTLTVKGGETDLFDRSVESTGTAAGAAIGDVVLPVEGNEREGRAIILVAEVDGAYHWKLKIVSASVGKSSYYIPGRQIYWDLARYSSVSAAGYLQDFQQLHQSGIINFRDRYYIQ